MKARPDDSETQKEVIYLKQTIATLIQGWGLEKEKFEGTVGELEKKPGEAEKERDRAQKEEEKGSEHWEEWEKKKPNLERVR